MESPTENPERGDFALAPFPFADLSQTKIRPALVVATVSRGDVIVAFITSQSTDGGAGDVILNQSDEEFDTSGLKLASTIRLERLVTIHNSIIGRRLGMAGPNTMARVEAALRAVLKL